MEIIRNEEKITRYRRISQFASIFGLTILGVGLFISLRGNPDQFVVQWITLLIGIAMWQISMNFAYKYARSPRPDEELDEGLKGANIKSYLYHYMLPAEHVLLTRSGVIVFSLKTQTGNISVGGENGDRWSRKGSMFKRFFGQEPALANPTRDALSQVDAVVKYIREKAPDLDEVPIGVIIVFLAKQGDVTLDVKESRIPAVHISVLKKYLRKQLGRPLPPEQFKRLREIFDDPDIEPPEYEHEEIEEGDSAEIIDA